MTLNLPVSRPLEVQSFFSESRAHFHQALCLLVSWPPGFLTPQIHEPQLETQCVFGIQQQHTPHSDVCLVCFTEDWGEVFPRRGLVTLRTKPFHCTATSSPFVPLSPWRRMFLSLFRKAWKFCDHCLNVSSEHHCPLRSHVKIPLPNKYGALLNGLLGNMSFPILAP